MKSVLAARAHAVMGWGLVVLLNLFAQQAYAVNPGGSSQTVHFAAIATKTLGNAPFAVGASATSGMAITSYGSATTSICTVSGSTVTLINAGSCELSAYQAGSSQWHSASGSVTFTVLPEPQTISFGALGNQTYLNPNFAVSATSSSGLGVSFAASPSNVCNMASASTVSIANAGVCTITASQGGSGNYAAAATVAQQFTVQPASQTISFAQLPALTFSSNATLTIAATSSSSLSVVFSSATPTICTVSGSTVTMAAGGLCTIDANVPATANYSAAPQVVNSFMLNIAPTISVIGPGDGAAFTPLSALTFTAGEAPGTYTVSTISYYDTAGGTVLCTATASPWSCTDSAGLAAGSYAVYAVITTSTSLSVNSLPITVTVGTGTGVPVSSSTPIPVAITAPSINNPAAGTLPGNLGVSNNGAATYTMPLALPPGVGGLVPNLSLNYSSQNSNGFLGLGWTLGGMSSIHRCNKTIAQDNITAGVNFTNTDRLCLDGQRLVLLTAGTGATGNPDVDYWTVGATYSTEVANFSRITSYAGSQGLAFKVESKAGRVLYYGDMGDGTSFIAAHGRSDGQAIVWALGQVQDLSGNYYTITYSNSTTANGEYLPTQINYGGNNQTGLAAHLSVLISYAQGRPDATVRYVAGSHNDMASLISNIQAYNGLYSSGTATKVREYDLTYTTSASSGRSTLFTVQMQALNPQTKAMVAFPATTFSWGQSGAPAFTQVSVAVNGPVAPWNATTSTANFNSIVWADFNGDGMMDAMVVDTSKSPTQYNIYMAQAGGGFAAPIVWTVPTSIATTIAQRQTAEAATGYAFQYAPVQNTATNNPGLSGWGLVGDFNGDGSSDLYLFGGFVCLSQLKTNPTAANAFSCVDSGTNTAATSGTGASLVSWNAEDYQVMSTTGSGLSDILVRNGQYADGTRCVSKMTNGTQSFTCGVYTGTNYVISGANGVSIAVPSVANQVGMFSGSGHQDVFRNNVPSGSTTNFMEVCTSGATGFNCSNWAVIPNVGTDGVAPNGYQDFPGYVLGTSTTADANGDGLTDVLISGLPPTGTTAGTNAAICYSTGVAFDCHILTATLGADSVIQHIGSIDGDGSVKTLAFEYNAAGTGGSWRTCVIQNANTTLNCQTINGGPAMPALSASQPDPIMMFGGFLNDGTLDLMSYDESIDTTAAGDKVNNYVSAGKAWTPYTLAPSATLAADKITSVTNGIGSTSSVSYTQGGTASVYMPYTTVSGATVYPTYPNVAVPNPGYLVSAIYNSNGQGGSVESTYAYVAQLTDASGRGSLGFAQINSTNVQSGFSTATNLTQAWPYTGLTSSTITTATNDGNSVLSNTSTTYVVTAVPNTYYSGNALAGGTETSTCVICFPYASASTTTSADLNGNDLGTTITNTITYDNFGNLLTSKSSSKLATDATSFVTSTTNTWDNDTGTCVASHGSTYVISKQCTSSVSKTSQAGKTIIRTAANTYFATGLTQTGTLEPTLTTLPSGDLQVINTYTRDGYGNVLTSVQSWLDQASATTLSRTATITYTSDGRFPATSTNAMGQTESYIVDPATGVKTQLTDMNNLVTSWTVDGLGRVLSQTSPTGNVTQTWVNQCASGGSDCPGYATSVTITTVSNGGQQITVPTLSYINALGQTIRTMSYGFTGTPIVTDRTFDARARPLASYQPTFASGATTTYPSGNLASQVATMDDLNRPLTTYTLDTSGTQLTTTMSYAGRTRTTVNPAGETRIETYDVLSQLIGVQINAFKNAPQTNTAFVYDPFGNLIQTTDPAGNIIIVGYDAMGHKIQLNDPDLGIIYYSVDPVGRTWKQVSPIENAKGQATTFKFDMLDRMISRLEPDLNSYFSYDVTGATGTSLTAAQITTCQTNHSCGKLIESYTAPLAGNVGMINTANSSKESDTVYNYDTLGRPANSTLTLDTSIGMTFYNETDYDAWSRPITQISQHGTDPQKIFDQRYNGYGYLQNVQRGGLTLWQATNQDAANRVVTAHIATASGGAADGLMVTRCYDTNTGRLDETVVATVAASVACGTTPAIATVMESYYYDVLGNVTQRNEAWNQGITGPITPQSFTEGFTYDGLSRIYTSTATSTVAGTVVNQPQQSFTYSVDGNIVTNPTAGTYTYTGGTSGGPHAVKTVSGAATAFTYDADGNQLTGNSRTNTWSSFDMPITLAYTGSGSQFATTSSQFTYGPNHERRTQSQGSTAIVYYGGAQEVLTNASHVVTEIKTYWPMGLGVEIDMPGQVASVLNWTHVDHLGSTIAITDIDGNLEEAMGYDTWGNRRNATAAPVSIATTLTTAVNENTDNKGYTGAEQITSLELVHLNGRVYDPLIGRFLSGDPHVTSPKNGQNYNRYSYVVNNPMNGIDPTGFDQKNSCKDDDGNCGGSGANTGNNTGHLTDLGGSGWTVYGSTNSTSTGTGAGNGLGLSEGSYVVTDTTGASATFNINADGTASNIVSTPANNGNATNTTTGGATPGTPAVSAGDQWMSFPGKNAVFTANDMGGDAETGPIPQVIVDTPTSPHNGTSGSSYADQQMGTLLQLPLQGALFATGGVLFEALGSTATVTRVTSWAGKGIVPNLNGTRWVMTGEATLSNYIKTGLWGPQWSQEAGWYFNNVPLNNAITQEVSNASLSWPSGFEWFKGFLGQRIFTP